MMEFFENDEEDSSMPDLVLTYNSDYESDDEKNSIDDDCNIIWQDKEREHDSGGESDSYNSDDEEVSMPNLIARDNSRWNEWDYDISDDNPSGDESDGEKSERDDTYILHNKHKATIAKSANKKARASVIFTLQYKEGTRK